jgi:hypothetical protein
MHEKKSYHSFLINNCFSINLKYNKGAFLLSLFHVTKNIVHMNSFMRVLHWHRNNSKVALLTWFTVGGTYVAYRIIDYEIESKQVKFKSHF